MLQCFAKALISDVDNTPLTADVQTLATITETQCYTSLVLNQHLCHKKISHGKFTGSGGFSCHDCEVEMSF